MSKKIKSGGGLTSNKLVRPRHIGGSPRTEVGSIAGVDALGQQLAYKRPDVIKRTAPAATRMGNDLATNVGKGGPGAGRVTHHCGSQGTHGPVTGTVRYGADILKEYGPEKSRG